MVYEHNTPNHYNMEYEPIVVFEAWSNNPDEYIGFCKLTVMKYLSRMGKKNTETQLSDAKKARDYLNWMIEALEKNQKTP